MKKIIVFYDESFPYEGSRPTQEKLCHLEKSFTVSRAEELNQVLNNNEVSCLISLHGPYFPKDSWASIVSCLEKGSGLLYLGGAPFRIPVIKTGSGNWRKEREQTAYHRYLQIHEALPVDEGPVEELKADKVIPIFAGKERLFSIEPTYNFILHVTRSRDHEGENGSSGPMDAHIYPLLKGVSKDDRDVSAPAVLIENTKGNFAGGRWIFVNQQLTSSFWEKGGIEALKEWAQFSRNGVTEIWMNPNYATYDPGDLPTLTVQIEKIQSYNNIDFKAIKKEHWTFDFTVSRETNGEKEVVYSGTSEIKVSCELQFLRIPLPVNVKKGFYMVECTCSSSLGERRILTQGFWGHDDELLKEGSMLICDRDYFWKDGRPFPVVGQTYMTSDVARKFLFIPNVFDWDKDMAQMKKAGINLIRTGLWTGWRNVMFVDGHAYEEVLRAIDAFILTAKKHDIEVTFNFFSFTPEAFEGENPYLDPRSVMAQKRFISAIVSRHTNTTNVHWDLINEPSMFDPKRIFQGPQTSHDKHEKEAFKKWIKERHSSIELLQERWNMTPLELPNFNSVELPEQEEINFDVHDIKIPKKGLRWLDYTLFTMDMHNQWVLELLETIKSINPNKMITVGQDEALSSERPGPLSSQRPTPFFYEEVVDYTTVHSWWLMDQLVWDGIFTKTPYKPNLIQETGIMYVETPDGKAKRSELELRNILERKYAYAYSTGGAGAVQWLWNTNIYMNNVNESNIGAIRADGTEKPEADVSYNFGRFIKDIRDLFVGRNLEDIVAVLPSSNDFSNRKVAFDATSKLTRVLSYEMHTPFRAIGEYHLKSLEIQHPKLIIVPSAHNFSEQARCKLFNHIEKNGGTLLWTGPLGLDEYWQPIQYLENKIGAYSLANILREEMLEIDGKRYCISFGQRRIAEINKEIPASSKGNTEYSLLKEISIGKGKLLWCPLPIELNERSKAIKALYDKAMKIAKIEKELEWIHGGDLPGIYGRKLTFEDGCLFIFVSEYSIDTRIKIKDQETKNVYSFLLEKERSVLFATDKSGKVISIYRPEEVNVEVE